MLPIQKAVLTAALLIQVSGCTVIDGGGMDQLVDTSLHTGSIKAPDPLVAADQISDGRTIRNAVSAADLARIEEAPLAWTNADTGASGQITAISEVREGGAICRRFTTSRQRFDGVSLYGGEACTAGAGEWVLTRFAEGG